MDSRLAEYDFRTGEKIKWTNLHDNGSDIGVLSGITSQLDPVKMDAVPVRFLQAEFPEHGKHQTKLLKLNRPM